MTQPIGNKGRTLRIADVIFISLGVIAVGVLLYIFLLPKYQSDAELLGHRNGIFVLETRDPTVYSMDQSDSLINMIKHYAPLENSEDLCFYFVTGELPQTSLDSLLNEQVPSQVQVDLQIEFKRQGSSLELTSMKASRNTKESRNEIVLL